MQPNLCFGSVLLQIPYILQVESASEERFFKACLLLLLAVVLVAVVVVVVVFGFWFWLFRLWFWLSSLSLGCGCGCGCSLGRFRALLAATFKVKTIKG